MLKTFGHYGPLFKSLGKGVEKMALFVSTHIGKKHKHYRQESEYARALGKDFQEKLARGETAYLVGIGAAGHNTGIALLEVSEEHGIRIISNHEEERFRAKKHCADFPVHSIKVLKRQLAEMNLTLDDIHCFLASWDYMAMLALTLRTAFEHAPASFALLKNSAEPNFNARHIETGLRAPKILSGQLNSPDITPIIGMEHHHNHAYFSYAVSPFALEEKPVMITVIDGTGDRGAISVYLVEDQKIKCLRQNDSIMDSLGVLYGYISATQGGWSFLSSEGRYMGAAAWGNMDRLTNPFYLRLRQILYFGENGSLHINRKMARWHISGQNNPYQQALIDILGEPIAQKDMWDPDAVLSVDDVTHSEITQQRVDKAAALQLVFEDALFHIVGALIKETGADRLVMSGGTALNCVANMKLLEHFDEAYYERYLNKKTHLNLWIPPVPADAGVVIGAAYQFAMQNGGKSKESLKTPFLCGLEPKKEDIQVALNKKKNIRYETLGNINDGADLEKIADFMAYLISNNGVAGIYQGAAETGPRALGHRSILANPCDPKTLETLNARVKFRERVRPLAPMVTLESAKRLFELSDGAATANFSAYDYMVLTVRANEIARQLIPAVIHHDGTSRIQIVRENNNPLIHAYLKAMGRYCGVEVSVNTSLNVGSPIVQTPEQAIEVLFRAKAMDGIFMVSKEGDVSLVTPVANEEGNSRIWTWHEEHSQKFTSQGITTTK